MESTALPGVNLYMTAAWRPGVVTRTAERHGLHSPQSPTPPGPSIQVPPGPISSSRLYKISILRALLISPTRS